MSRPLLIEIARDAIEARFKGIDVDKTKYTHHQAQLQKHQATFVTLTLDGELRGCIGSIIAHRPLVDDLISNAQAAAFSDPRFYPLSYEEYRNINVEVSLLSEPQSLEYTDVGDLRRQIVPKKDGVILKHHNHQATFLPQVWDQLPTFDLFFSHLGLKAGIGDDPLSFHPDIYVYHVEKIEE